MHLGCGGTGVIAGGAPSASSEKLASIGIRGGIVGQPVDFTDESVEFGFRGGRVDLLQSLNSPRCEP
jgi:hypothetical protein